MKIENNNTIVIIINDLEIAKGSDKIYFVEKKCFGGEEVGRFRILFKI